MQKIELKHYNQIAIVKNPNEMLVYRVLTLWLGGEDSWKFKHITFVIIQRFIKKNFKIELNYRQIRYILANLVKKGIIERRVFYKVNKESKLIKCSAFRISPYRKVR